MAITADIAFKDAALRYGFKYSIITDEWVSDSGARIPCRDLKPKQLLDIMRASSELSGDVWQVHHPRPAEPPRKRSNYEKLAVRMDVEPGATFPFDHCHIVETSTEVCVLIVYKDQCVLLRDDINLFPSDAFLGKIRLLL